MDKLKLDLPDFGMRASPGLHTVGLKDLLDSRSPMQKIAENFRESLIRSQSNRVEELLRSSRLSLRDFSTDYVARFEEREKQLWKDRFGCIPGFVGKRNPDFLPEISQPATILERESETVQLIRADDYAAMRKALARLNGKKSAQSETVRQKKANRAAMILAYESSGMNKDSFAYAHCADYGYVEDTARNYLKRKALSEFKKNNAEFFP